MEKFSFSFLNNNLICVNDVEEEKNCSLNSGNKIQRNNLLNENKIKMQKDIDENLDNSNNYEVKNRGQYIELKKDDKKENIKFNLRYSDNYNKNNENSEKDISAEKDIEKDIHWEFNCSNDIIEEKKENKIYNEKQKDEDYEGDFEDLKSYSEYSDICNQSYSFNQKNNNHISNLNDINNKKINEKEIHNNINNYINNNNNVIDNENIKKPSTVMESQNKFVDDLTEEIINSLCKEEIILSNVKLIPNKIFNNESKNNNLLINNSNNKTISKDLNNLGINVPDISLDDNSILSLNNSLIFSSSTYSIFNNNIKDKKITNSMNLYMNKIFPKFIKLIQKELVEKHKRIFENISTPFTNNSKNIMISLSLNDKKMLKENFKLKIFKENLEDIINKEDILKKFDEINKQIRIKDNISSDNYYDKMINECIIDTAIELINKERIHFRKGEPLLWDKQEKEVINKYDIRNNPVKFSKYICKSLVYLINKKIGLIPDKYNILNLENINETNEKILNNMIKEEIKENGNKWDNLDIEETKAKIDVTQYIFEMLLTENIEILEHVQNNRKRPELYNYKSIYNCQNMPKLEFQINEKSSNYIDDSENDLINI